MFTSIREIRFHTLAVTQIFVLMTIFRRSVELETWFDMISSLTLVFVRVSRVRLSLNGLFQSLRSGPFQFLRFFLFSPVQSILSGSVYSLWFSLRFVLVSPVRSSLSGSVQSLRFSLFSLRVQSILSPVQSPVCSSLSGPFQSFRFSTVSPVRSSLSCSFESLMFV